MKQLSCYREQDLGGGEKKKLVSWQQEHFLTSHLIIVISRIVI